MPHRSDNLDIQPRPASPLREYALAIILAAAIMAPTWTIIWWLLP